MNIDLPVQTVPDEFYIFMFWVITWVAAYAFAHIACVLYARWTNMRSDRQWHFAQMIIIFVISLAASVTLLVFYSPTQVKIGLDELMKRHDTAGPTVFGIIFWASLAVLAISLIVTPVLAIVFYRKDRKSVHPVDNDYSYLAH